MWKILATLITLSLAGFVAYQSFRSPAIVVVDSVVVENGQIASTLSLTGTLINDRTVTITALLDGEVVNINAREGDHVERDTVLAELDNREARARYRKAVADLDYQRSHLAIANNSHQRLAVLYSKGNTSQQTLDDALLEKRRLQAAVKVAEAELQIRELEIENAQVLAPFTGIITAQTAEIGQWVEAGTRLFTLVADEGRVIEVQINADDAGRVSLQQSVTLSTEAWPGREWLSRVIWLAPSITSGNDNNNAFAARIALGEDAPPLLLDQQLDAVLQTDSRSNVPVIPQTALQDVTAGTASVWVYEAGTARRRSLQTGLYSIDDVEVVRGLNPGERVILPGREPIHDGDAVLLREERPAP